MNYPNLAGKKIALGVCGGISAYKAAGLARELGRAGADVHVVMTPSATNFVGPITFSTLTGNPVRSELFPVSAPTEIPHTDLGSTADLVLVAPVTANMIAKVANGLSDDLMSALLLSAACPVVIAPAMHTEMWLNEATQVNVARLLARGIEMVGPAVGALAGPDAGIGRLVEIDLILAAADDALAKRCSLAGQRVVVTAGGTREAIDPMRYIGNASTGLMGYALALEALRRGAQVTLISGPSQLTPPEAAELVKVTSAQEMAEAVGRVIGSASVLLMAAAVADWRPVAPSPAKLGKSSGPPEIELEPAPDILAGIGSRRSALPGLKVLVGFCAESGELRAAAQSKLTAKNLDLAVANRVGALDSGAGLATLRALIVDREGGTLDLGLVSKKDLAFRLMELVYARLAQVPTTAGA
ncbi:MAG: bifunctional phosphopantothenoylcysteine decarboxylase/phosphopantothenate--cysteine ligase CoaBC [Actinomycetota bacterium]